MIIRRRKQIVKVTICMIYVIGVLVIARRIMRVPDSFAFDSSATGPHRSSRWIDHNNGRIGTQASTLDEEERAKHEEWISNWEQNIVHSLGDKGKPAKLYGSEQIEAQKVLDVKALNVILSDKIPLTRRLEDPRDPLCKNVTYDSVLPSASVIIIFYNEPWSALLRTVRSVLSRSPEQHLKEIILVDDHSHEEELHGRLDYYIETRFPKKVRLIRLSKRLGLIRARLAGAQSAKGDVLIFLDAHCEVTTQWLEPLLQRIKEKPDAVVMPIIDNISEDTLEYLRDDDPTVFQVGGFTWSGHFTWINIQEKDINSRPSRISPVRSPTMAGGLFAIDRKYFWNIGSYDAGMDGWGGENLEISFRIWQCGGSLEAIPCSRVGHIFRAFHPYKFPNDKDTHGINTARLVYVWMDDYKRLFFFYRDEFKNNKSIIGDISERLELRKRLGCKSFKWYLDNVYPEKFIPDEKVVGYGRLKLRHRYMCIDNLQRDEEKPYPLGLYKCHDKVFPSQLISLSENNELRRDQVCAVVDTKDMNGTHYKVQMIECTNDFDLGEWILTERGKIVNVGTGLCLDATRVKSQGDVFAAPCSDKAPDQFWEFDFHGNQITPR